MAATKHNPMIPKGEKTRAAIETAALAAGDEGLRVRHLAAALGFSNHGVDFQVAKMTTVIKAVTRNKHKGRLFHVAHRAAADAYIERCNASVRPPGASAKSLANARLILKRAGARGMSTAEIVAATGLKRPSVQGMMKRMCEAGDAAWEHDKREGKSQQRRFWAEGFTPIKQQPPTKAHLYECVKTGKPAVPTKSMPREVIVPAGIVVQRYTPKTQPVAHPPPRRIDSSAARPWAQAAAGSIERGTE